MPKTDPPSVALDRNAAVHRNVLAAVANELASVLGRRDWTGEIVVRVTVQQGRITGYRAGGLRQSALSVYDRDR